MDLSKFEPQHWLVVGGAAALFVFGFFDWVEVSAFGFSDTGGNVFDFFWTGTIPWLLVMASATILVLLSQDVVRHESAPWPLLILAGTVVSAALLVLRLVVNPIDGADVIEDAGGSVGRTTWMFLAVAGGVAAAVGGVLNFRAEGGSVQDLTDVAKLRQSFSTRSGEDRPPPPPPPA